LVKDTTLTRVLCYHPNGQIRSVFQIPDDELM